ncbi:MobA-like NTP transferase domain-containing protein [Ruminococcus sp. YE71]|nr:NTP transferase domain-containing protein [Ruminococcus sp. YE78]SDA10144.1 MobA-like NTP transferase domain-containing protein [Ruminococcus sp. YE78]SFW11064.1 MobA-like NTP transferase domain-containing protein [Ruminococcus sp. YE71]
MQIIIPMTGYGSRFVAAGYPDLKPLIPVHGIPIIEWIVRGMYKGEDDFLFVCRKEHLETISKLGPTLRRIAPKGRIFAIDDWIKKGPVYDVLRAADEIKDDEPCIVNYCDFYQEWDHSDFVRKALERGCEGAVPCYSGFHPNLLPQKNLYASCRVDDEENLIEIREKYSFEKDKTRARHSPGVYYFKNGALLKTYFERQVREGTEINGEHYASLPYNFMVEDGLKVWCPINVRYFCQWGTPEDMQEYLFWSELTRRYDK